MSKIMESFELDILETGEIDMNTPIGDELEESGNEFQTKDPTDQQDQNKTLPGHNPTTPGPVDTTDAQTYDDGYAKIPHKGAIDTTDGQTYNDGYVKIPTPGGGVGTAKHGGGGTTITSQDYNFALDRLQKSFKEQIDIIEMLKEQRVEYLSPEEIQDRYAEDMMYEAMLLSYEDGPMFEAVDRDDKDEVKKIVRNLRSKVKQHLAEDGIQIYIPNLILRTIVGALTSPMGALELSNGLTGLWKTRLWQMLGVVNVEKGNIRDVIKRMNDEFKEELGDYKILHVATIPTIRDIFINRFGWKNTRHAHFLLIDKKVPSELKTFQKDAAKAMVKEENADFSLFDMDDDMIIESVLTEGVQATLGRVREERNIEKDSKDFHAKDLVDAYLSKDKKKQEEVRAEFDKFMSSKEGTLTFD